MQITISDSLKNKPRGFWIGILLLVVILTDILVTQFPWPILGAVGSILLLISLLLRPGWVLIFLLLYIWLIAGRTDPGDLWESYPIIRWGSYLLIPVLAGLGMLRVEARGSWQKGLIEPFLLLMVGIIIFSGFLNNTDLASILFSIGIYLRYPIIFLLLMNLGLRHIDYRRALHWFIMITLFLVMEAMFNYAFFGKEEDRTFFTLGIRHGTAPAGLFFTYTLCFVIARALRTKTHFYHLLLLALVAVSSWIASIKSLIFVVPILFLLLYGVSRHLLRSLSIVMLALLSLGLLVAAVFVPWHQMAQSVEGSMEFSPGYRFDVARQTFQILSSSDKLLFGWGPRSFSPGTIGQAGSMFEKLAAHYGTKYFVIPGQLGIGFSELGIIGFGIYWMMLLVILWMNLRFWKSSACETAGPRWDIISLAFIGIWFHYAVLGLWIYDLWRVDISSLVFWGCAAAIYGEKCRRSISKDAYEYLDR